MSFDPKRHVIRVQGNREYLPASARLVWFRQDHPDWGIVTQPIEINLAPAPEVKRPPYAIFMAQVFNAEGKLMATAHKYEDSKGFPDFLEKAETGAVARALAMCGYGTQFAPEFEEADRFSDAPRGGSRFAAAPSRPPMNGGGGGGNGGNGFGNRPNAPMNSAPMNGRSGDNRPAGGRDGGFSEPAPREMREPERVSDRVPEEAPRAAAPPAPSAAAGKVAEARPAPAAGAGITRVKEPEREYDDPGGPDMDDEEDPFAEEAPAPRAAAAPAANRPAPARPVAAREDSAGEEAPPPAPKPNPLGSNRCSVEGCTLVLTPSQMTMSMNKFGKAVCLAHQKDPAVTGGGGGAARRPARSEQDALL